MPRVWQESRDSSKQREFTEQDIKSKNSDKKVHAIDLSCSLEFSDEDVPVWQDQPSSIYFACLPPKSILTNFKCPDIGDWLNKQRHTDSKEKPHAATKKDID